ncbi:MAG: hypothetical protein E6G90_19260 [Alphaproteobacteria bacterium]|nr:MAG: hypothetical protein E6G90_19260 [Alphaproteobacteria bacterium]
MNASSGLRAMLLVQGAELRRRHQEALARGWRQKIPLLASCVAVMGVYFAGAGDPGYRTRQDRLGYRPVILHF